jgi:predicted O-methyltransferase YrrM
MNIVSGVRQVLAGPVDASYKVIAQWHERKEWQRQKPPCRYEIDDDWRQLLGVTDDDREKTDRLYRSIEATLIAQGIRPGPESYSMFNDGDPAFVQAIWSLIRNLNATKIVETGVAHGVTTRFILEALAGRGHLWSIDLPPPAAPELHRDIGIAVGTWPTEQWSLILGPSRRRLPKLLASIAPIDIFIHDSQHSEYNMLFEMTRAWDALRPGGALVVDDVDLNWAFQDFSRMVNARKLIAEAEPIRADTRRFNEKGLFGILIKPDR